MFWSGSGEQLLPKYVAWLHLNAAGTPTVHVWAIKLLPNNRVQKRSNGFLILP
jgi:hypothetical protein